MTDALRECDHHRKWAESIGATLPEVAAEPYVTWNHDEITALIPGLDKALPDRDTLNMTLAMEAVDAEATRIMEKVSASDIQRAIQAASENPSVENIKALYDAANEVQLLISPMAMVFPMVFSHYVGGGVNSDDVEKLVMHIKERLQGVTQVMGATIPIIASIPEKQKKALLEAEELAPYRHTLKTVFDTSMTFDAETHPKLLEAVQHHSQASFEAANEANDPSKSPKERLDALARNIEHVMRLKVAGAQFQGYDSTFDMAKAVSGLNPTDQKSVKEALEKRKTDKTANLTKPPRVLEDMASDSIGKYSYDEAIDIVVSTLNRVHPSLGDKFTECLENGRAHIEKAPAASANAFPGEYDSETGKRKPPRFEATFNGGMQDILLIAHEAAHVAHFALSAEANKANATQPNILVAEHFSHFMELMLRDELLERAETKVDKAAINSYFQLHIANSMLLQCVALFEETLCTKIEKEGAESLTYEDVNSAYKEAATLTFGKGSKLAKTSIQDSPVFLNSLHTSYQWSPHQTSAYFGNASLAYALAEKRDENPAEFGEAFVEAMKAGGHLDYEGLVDRYFGEGHYKDTNVYSKGLEAWQRARDEALESITEITRPNLSLTSMGVDMAKMLQHLTVPNHPDDIAASDAISKIFAKYEPLIYRNPTAMKVMEGYEKLFTAWTNARDYEFDKQLHTLTEDIHPEWGTSIKIMEREDLLDALARGEVSEIRGLEPRKYEISDKAYDIAEGVKYDPQHRRVFYQDDNGNELSTKAEDYIMETDNGFETAAEHVAKLEKGRTFGKFSEAVHEEREADKDAASYIS